jgi:formylglycine-generating enzyme required for sulfatase activity
MVLAAGLPALPKEVERDALTTAATGETIPHPLSKRTQRVNDVDVPEGMVYVPAGKFTMGERQAVHEVYLDGFCMAKYLVTNAEYKAFATATGHTRLPRHWRNTTFPEGKANHPVLWVSWDDAQEYCAWVSKGTGRVVALPTEAQWEKAARGPKAFLYPWGNDANTENLNYNGLCARKFGLEVTANGHVSGWKEFTATPPYRELVDHGGYTTPVGAYPRGKSFYGCYDMAGNAWQWCTDWYMQEYYKLPDANHNPKGPSREKADDVHRAAERGKVKVVRGGSWYAHLISARSVFREETRRPEGGYHSVGFRIAGLVGA